jgi:hypothetical protein
MFNKPTSEHVEAEQNKMEPVGPRPKIRPVGLGLRPDPPLIDSITKKLKLKLKNVHKQLLGSLPFH